MIRRSRRNSLAAPNFLGLLPAITQARREQYAAIAQQYDTIVHQLIARRLIDA
jgi:hypothetical protein